MSGVDTRNSNVRKVLQQVRKGYSDEINLIRDHETMFRLRTMELFTI